MLWCLREDDRHPGPRHGGAREAPDERARPLLQGCGQRGDPRRARPRRREADAPHAGVGPRSAHGQPGPGARACGRAGGRRAGPEAADRQVKLVDANVLLYAVNEAEPRHADAHRWLDSSLNGTEAVGFAWTVLLAFIRLSTKAGLFPRPLQVDASLDIVRLWVGAGPGVVVG